MLRLKYCLSVLFVGSLQSANVRHRSRSEKLELQLASLSRKKIVFGANDNAVKVKAKLEQAYPKLEKEGGFEILRSGVSTSVCGLCVLKTPAASGYSVHFLRNESGLGQALAYLHPLQRVHDMPLSVTVIILSSRVAILRSSITRHNSLLHWRIFVGVLK